MGAADCLKVTLILVNVVVVFLGFGLLGVGVYLQLQTDVLGPYLSVAGVHHTTFSAVLIVDGLLCIAIGGAGILGARLAHRGCLTFYSTLLTIIFLILVTAGGLIYGFRNKVGGTIEEAMVTSLAQYNATFADTDGWNKVQQMLSCCGVRNYTEYGRIGSWKSQGLTFLPASCCKNSTDGMCGSNEVNRIGCYTGVLDELLGKWYTWGGGAIGIGFSLLFCVLIASMYYCQITSYDNL